jgi:tRNA-dihydrouridine synthase B
MIKNNFWNELKKNCRPILALAPMAGFTDPAFRQLCRQQGADVLYSEMVSATALYYIDKDKSRQGENSVETTRDLLQFDPKKEKYYVVQIFGSLPEHFAVAAKMINEKIRPHGLDINFGCPVNKIIKQGAGANLMKDLKRSRKVIQAVLDNTDLPVSIKIRSSSGEIGALEFLSNISDLPLSALMIHGRSLNQGFTGKVDHGLAKKARDYFKGVILTNGGINNLDSARLAWQESLADGLGLARGVLGRPWLFSEIKDDKNKELSGSEILALMLKHAKLFVEKKSEAALIELRKHLVWYVQGFSRAKYWREKLVKIESVNDIEKIINEYQKGL